MSSPALAPQPAVVSEDRLLTNLNKREIPSLWGVRGIAALVVVLGHYCYNVPEVALFKAGYAVSLFFILSGLLITWLLLKEQASSGRIDFRQFYIRRALRLWPAFYATWAFCALSLHPFRAKWATFFYVSDYYLALGGGYSTLTIAWSLGVEEKFYVLWPAILRHLHKSNFPRWIVGVILADQLYREILSQTRYAAWGAFSFDANLDCILMGCLIAILAHRGIGFPRWMGSLWVPIASLTSLYTCNQIIVHDLLALLLIWSIIRAPWILNNAVAKYLGLISYSLYLVHLPAEDIIWPHILPHVEHYRWSIQLGAKLMLAVLSASVLHYAVERPFLKLKDHFHRASLIKKR